jgi:general secretion pathway protein D
MNKHILFLASILTLIAPQDRVHAQTTPESILQKEVIRRQEIILRSIQDIESTEQLVREGKNDEARARLAEILRTIPEQGEGAPVYEKAAMLLSNIEISEAEAALRAKNWFSARESALAALGYNPNSQNAKNILSKANEELGIRNNDESTLNPAIDRKFVGNVNRVNELIRSSQDLMKTGQFDAAEKELGRALDIDPFNNTAAQELKKIYIKRLRAAEVARKSSIQERLTETRVGWTQRIQTEKASDAPSTNGAPLRRVPNFSISRKLDTIIIPNVDFNDANIADAANFLTLRTRELDPDGVGVSVLLKNEAVSSSSNSFSLRLSNIPAGEALRYICSLAGVKFRVEEFAVFVVPLAEPESTVLLNREFPVRPAFFDVAPASEAAPQATDRRRTPRSTTVTASLGTDSVREALESRGVSFAADGSAAFYNQSTGILTARNTQDQIDLIEELVTDESGESLVVKIDTRVVEITQTDLEALSVNGTLAANPLSFVNPGGTAFSSSSVGVSSGLQGANSLKTSDAIQSFLAPGASAINSVPNATEANKFGVAGLLDGNRFRLLFEALSQKSSFELMTAPSIIINDGQQGTITVAREFYYPTEFDEAQVTAATVVSSTTVVPAWPTEFQARNVGVVLTAQPRITVDRQRVFLTLKPDITEFDGYINYGSRIFSTRSDNAFFGVPLNQVISNNVINQPVFSVRTVENAQLEIQDGYTMVLGGLIREDISTVEDKVPILGDLPLIGRAFRSTAEQATKRNLLIFVSVRILRPDGQPFNASAGELASAK